MEYKAKILLSEFVTHDVKRFIVEKPKRYKFTPGQATEVAINEPHWKDKRHPFTFTSLNSDLVLEFTIKAYDPKTNKGHEGVTQKLHSLPPNSEILLGNPFGTISYKGPGVFIAGGAGITPFIAILRQLKQDGKIKGNKLFFSNKTKKDVILEKEWREMFTQEDLVLTLTREEYKGFENGHIDIDFFKNHVNDFSQNFYVCGPGKMVVEIKKILSNLGAQVDSIVFEE